MGNPYFKFKKFTIYQDRCAMKVTSLACIQGAWLPACTPSRILDIGSGTGLLSLMAAQQFDCHVHAVEIDSDAYHQLSDNFRRSPWSDRLNAIHKDILIFAVQNHCKYDLIITNPPFFTNHLKSPDPKINLARHEQLLSLPLLVNAIDSLLSDCGFISILLPSDQTDVAIKLFQDRSISLIRQLCIVDKTLQNPKAIVSVFAREKREVIIETMVIKSADGTYTSQYKALLKDYYLNL